MSKVIIANFDENEENKKNGENMDQPIQENESVVSHSENVPENVEKVEDDLVFPEQSFPFRELSKTPDPYIIELLISCRNHLFKDTQNKTYVVFPSERTVKIYEIESEKFKSYITYDYFMQTGEAIKRTYLRQVVSLLDSLAKEHGKVANLELRCNWDADSIMYDLHDKDHHVVRINDRGWAIEYCQKPLFKSYPHQLAQLMPADGGSLDEFIDMFNVSPEDKQLFKVFVVSHFIPGFPHPILKIEGEKGSAKSTAARLLKALVDPSKVGLLSFPRENREIVQQLDHHYFLGYDNLSSVPRWASDALCRASSGDGYSCRKLHTSDEDIIRSFRRCLSINGLDLGALPDDLLDRCLIINFKRISEVNRRTDSDIWARFQEILPGTLSEIFEIISNAMRIYPTVKLSKIFRLADFTKWGYAIGQAIDADHGGNKFYGDYRKMVNRQEDVSVDDNVLLLALSYFYEKRSEWDGTPLQLYAQLKSIVEQQRLDQKHVTWPKAPNYLSRRLRAYQSLLQSQGITIEFLGRTATQRRIRLTKAVQTPVVESSAPTTKG